jgi:hypothetical protein
MTTDPIETVGVGMLGYSLMGKAHANAPPASVANNINDLAGS